MGGKNHKKQIETKRHKHSHTEKYHKNTKPQAITYKQKICKT